MSNVYAENYMNAQIDNHNRYIDAIQSVANEFKSVSDVSVEDMFSLLSKNYTFLNKMQSWLENTLETIDNIHQAQDCINHNTPLLLARYKDIPERE